jgi:RHS repeat-associated protein
LFTSKELDRETGMYYFGARYQDPKLGIFISVDPMAEQYAGYSSYAYTLNNPVKFTDPSGMSSEDGIDPPAKSKKADTTSRLDGYNRTVGEYNTRFNEKVDSFFRGNPFSQAADGIHDFLNSSAMLVNDCIGITDLFRKENNTRNALGGLINTVASSPNMTKEQQGVALGMAAIVVTEIAITEKVPVKNFTVVAKEGNLVFFSTKVAGKTVEFGGEVSKRKGVFTIKNLDIDGKLTNELGWRGVRDLMKAFGKEHKATEVIIEGAKRTTGANPGKITKLSIKID